MTDAPTLTVELSKAYPSHKGELRSLELREPSAMDYSILSLPGKQIKHPDGGVENRIDFSGIIRWASRLSGVEVGIIETFNKGDLWKLVEMVSQWIGADGDKEPDVKN